jgi:hypothetical protein
VKNLSPFTALLTPSGAYRPETERRNYNVIFQSENKIMKKLQMAMEHANRLLEF